MLEGVGCVRALAPYSLCPTSDARRIFGDPLELWGRSRFGEWLHSIRTGQPVGCEAVKIHLEQFQFPLKALNHSFLIGGPQKHNLKVSNYWPQQALNSPELPSKCS